MGGSLLKQAERVASQTLGATTLELWVLSCREELVRWYERRGFVADNVHVPFATVADERLALVPGLEFASFTKRLTQ
jgi:hypothetical protein